MPHGADKSTAFKSILLAVGDPESNPDFYLPGGGATQADFQNLINVVFERTTPGSAERREAVIGLSEVGFFTSGDSLSFWINATDEEVAAEQEGLATAVDRLASPDEDTATAGQFISGGQIVKIERAGQEPLWGVSFTVSGGIEHIYTFGSEEELNASLGANAATTHGFTTINDTDLNQGDIWVMGDAALFAGQEGSYAGFWGDLVNEVALASGIRDPGRLGDYMKDPEVARLMAEGAQAGWTSVQLQAELRQTDYYQNTLYPGIKNILNRGDTLNPEQEWKEYAKTVEDSLRLLGYSPDEDGSYASLIGKMLDKNIEQDDFTTIAPLFKRAQENPEMEEALRFWLGQEAGRNVTFDDLFDAIAGLDTGDLTDAIEKAVIQFHANTTGTLLSADQITRLADLSDLSEQQIALAFSANEEAVLALGPSGLARSGLSENDLISAAFDLKSVSGRTANEIRRLAKKTLTELGLEDDPKAQFFTGFTQAGRPAKTGLLAGAPEAG